MINTIGATLYVTMVTCHHHFWKWWWLSPPLFFTFSLYFGQENRIFLATRSVLCLKICRQCDSGRGSALDLDEELMTLPRPLVGWGADTPPQTSPNSAPLAPRSSCPSDTKSWRRHWSPPLFKVSCASERHPYTKTNKFGCYGNVCWGIVNWFQIDNPRPQFYLSWKLAKVGTVDLKYLVWQELFKITK